MKKILAVAIASAFAAPAFAATSNVDVYGILNVGVFSVNSDVAGDDRQTNVSSQASRIGFKGTEDLGGGLKAVWQIESGVNADESGGQFASRNTFVGLAGGFGTVLIGRHDTPMKMLARKVDNFGDTYADSRNLLGSESETGTNLFDLRTNNTIAYVSPNFSGLTVTAAYVADHQQLTFGTTPTSLTAPTECAAGLDCNDNDAYSVTVDYANGPLMLGAGYERHNIAFIDPVDGAIDADSSMWRLVGGYKFGDFKLGAQYEKGTGDMEVANRKAWGLFGSYAMGAITLKANYLKVNDYEDSNDTGAKQYTFGADYALSKRTTAYALYAKVKNDTNAGFGVGGSTGSDSTVGKVNTDPSVFGVGVKHSF